MIELKGLSWCHRRATGPLAPLVGRFRKNHPEIDITWTVRPLSDFEHQSLESIARDFDFIIYDHPFSGGLAQSRAFVALDELLPGLAPEDDACFVGPSLTSYCYQGAVWGVPIDAATEHAVYRADLLSASLPRQWDDVIELGGRLSSEGRFLGLACETPHALLVLAALMANAGRPWSTDPSQRFELDPQLLAEGLDLLTHLRSFCPPEAANWNSIDLHEAMVARDDIVYAPCVYGYATYGEADMRRRLSFGPFPGIRAPFAAGTAVGGTALGLSRYCRHQDAARAFMTFVLTHEAQVEIIPRFHGQPALREAWEDPDVDARFNGFFSATRETIERAWIRPRLPGYPEFQKQAGTVVRRFLAQELSAIQAVDQVLRLADQVNAERVPA